MAVRFNSTANTGYFMSRSSSLVSPPSMNSPFTLACRVKFQTTSTTNYHALVAIYGSGGTTACYILRNSGVPSSSTGIRFARLGSSSDNADTTVGYGSTTAWVHCCMTWDGSTILGYIDGAQQASVASTQTISGGATPAYLSQGGPGNLTICDSVIIGRALTAAEVAKLAKYRDARVFNKNGDIAAWWPGYSPGTNTDWGKDFSGRGNDAIATAGTGTQPAADTDNPPQGWTTRLVRGAFIPPGSLIGSANSPTSGSASLSLAFSLTETATSPTSGSASLSIALPLTASATSPTSGAVSLSVAMPIAGSAVSPTSGTVSLLVAMPLAGTAVSPTSGTAALNIALPIAATATSPTQATVTLSAALPVAASGVSPTSGTVALQVDFPLVASAVSPTSGSAVLNGATNTDLASSGTSPTSGAAALDLAFSLAASGISPTSGAAALALANSLSSSGLSPTSGTAALSLSNQLAVSGVSPTSGTATLTLAFSLQATGASSTSGSAVLNGANPPANWPDPPIIRRYLGGYGRRPIR